MLDKLITTSILNVEKKQRKETINRLIELGIKCIHYDVMDGEFVPSRAFRNRWNNFMFWNLKKLLYIFQLISTYKFIALENSSRIFMNFLNDLI